MKKWKKRGNKRDKRYYRDKKNGKDKRDLYKRNRKDRIQKMR